VRPLFLDAGFVIALELEDDENHPQARGVWLTVRHERRALLSTSLVVAEVVAFFSRRRRHDLAVAASRKMLFSPGMDLVHVAKPLFMEGWAYFQQRPDKDYSLTDCVSFVLMQERRVREALSFDHHFTQAGFVQLP
jgi:uncharacterized protein